MHCVNHPDRAAGGTCVYCGKFYCADCLVEVDGRMVCRGDVTRMVRDVREQAQPVQVSVSNVNNNENVNQNGPGGYGYYGAYSHRSRLAALLLCIFLGGLGVHRFYVGKVGTGLLYLFTFGAFGIGWLVDLITIATGNFGDNANLPLV